EGGDRHVGVGLAGAGDENDVHLGVAQRLAEIGRPLLVAVLGRELLGRRRLPPRGGSSCRFVGPARPTTVCSWTSSRRCSASECQIPIMPWPTMHTLSIEVFLPGVGAARLTRGT